MTENANPAPIPPAAQATILSGVEAVVLAAHLLDAKKAEEIKLLDVRGICGFTDFFLLATAPSGTQLRALASLLRESLKAVGYRSLSDEFLPNTSWLVVDAGDLVAHIFLPEARLFYNLERLWGDGPPLPWQTGDAATKAQVLVPKLLAGGASFAFTEGQGTMGLGYTDSTTE